MFALRSAIRISTKRARFFSSQHPSYSDYLDLSIFPEKFQEVFQDEKYVIINKAPGFDCQDLPKGNKINKGKDVRGIFSLLKSIDPEMRNVHRLDKWVSGGLIVARDKITSQRFSRQLKKGGEHGYGFKRRYVAIIKSGQFPEPSKHLKYFDSLKRSGTIETYNEKGECITKFIQIPSEDEYSLVVLQLETGRKHQIRQHLSEVIGKPIFNDKRYGFPGELPDGKQRTIGLHSAFVQTQVGLTKREFQIPVKYNVNGMWDGFIDSNGNFSEEVQDVLNNFEKIHSPSPTTASEREETELSS
jgi:21S rRNA pseudouridine2819 synthase